MVAKKLILIGLDGASAEIVKYWMEEGAMPNTVKLAGRGVFSHIFCPYPTLTPPNWTTIATGAWPGSHGITSFWLHMPGQPLDSVVYGFDTGYSQAEYLWDAAERVGKHSIILKYESSWPPTHKCGYQVEGLGPGGTSYFAISEDMLFTLADWPLVTTIKLAPAEDWLNLPPSSRPPLESRLVIRPRTGVLDRSEGSGPSRQLIRSIYAKGEEKIFHLLLVAQGEGYDTAIVARSKDAQDSIASLEPGQWSDWIIEPFQIDDAPLAGSFKLKLLKLSPSASELELFMTQAFPTKGYFFPEELGEELLREVGPFLQNPGRSARGALWIDDDTYMDLIEYHNDWLAKAAIYLMENKKWGLLFMETHVSDYLSHQYIDQMDPISGYPEEVREAAHSAIRRGYESIDRMIGKVVEKADQDTLIMIVSDHGGTAGPIPGSRADPTLALEQAGLLVYKEEPQTARRVIDWSRTKAVPLMQYVWVNLKGRDPQGIVELEEYEEVRHQIIDALSAYRDPKTGRQPFSLIAKREDARGFGQYGPMAGDIVWAVFPEFSAAHGNQLPTATYGIGSMHSLFIMAGPGVKRGYGPLKGNWWLTSVAPTAAHLLRIPVPQQAEGSIIWEALEDPDEWLAERARLSEERDRWKAAYRSHQELTHIG